MIAARHLPLASLLALAACGGQAQPSPQASSPAAEPAAAENATEAMRAYADANDRMHAAMGQIDRDPDVAFVQGMIPHHRGAVDMAEIVLKHGKDPETRALAQRIIAAQRGEIAEMEAWLTKRSKSPAPAGAGDAAAEHHGH